jgi:hypothetical protein
MQTSADLECLESEDAYEARSFAVFALRVLAVMSTESVSPAVRVYAHRTLVGWLCGIRALLADPELSAELRGEMNQVLREFLDS